MVVFLISILFLLNKEEFSYAAAWAEDNGYEQLMDILIPYLNGEHGAWGYQTGEIGEEGEYNEEYDVYSLNEDEDSWDMSECTVWKSMVNGQIVSLHMEIALAGEVTSYYSVYAERHETCIVDEDNNTITYYSSENGTWDKKAADARPVYLMEITFPGYSSSTTVQILYDNGTMYWINQWDGRMENDNGEDEEYSILGQGKEAFTESQLMRMELSLFGEVMDEFFLIVTVIGIFGVYVDYRNRKKPDWQSMAGCLPVKKCDIWLCGWIANEFYLAAAYLGAFLAMTLMFHHTTFMSRIPSCLFGRLLLSGLLVTVVEWGVSRFRNMWAALLVPALCPIVITAAGWAVSEYMCHFFRYTGYTLKTWMQIIRLVLYQMKDAAIRELDVRSNRLHTYTEWSEVHQTGSFLCLTDVQYWTLFGVGTALIMLLIWLFVRDGRRCFSKLEYSNPKLTSWETYSDRTKMAAYYGGVLVFVMAAANIVMETVTYYKTAAYLGTEKGAYGVQYLEIEVTGFSSALKKILTPEVTIMPPWLSVILGILILAAGFAAGGYGLKLYKESKKRREEETADEDNHEKDRFEGLY